MEAEIVVVGAGPAGAMTAMDLAQRGHDVILIDRHDFPRDKICGDAVPAHAIEQMWAHGMKDVVANEIDQGHFHVVRSMRLVSPRGHAAEADFRLGAMGAHSVVAPRIYLDAALQRHAVASGARFVIGQAQEPILENGYVTGVRVRVDKEDKEIRGKMVVAADGVTSVIARALRPANDEPQDGHRAVAIRAYIEDMELVKDQIEFFLYKGILPGYAWVFPISETEANIGLGMRLDKFRGLKGNLKEMLGYFLEIPDVKKRLRRGGVMREVRSWQLNFGSQDIQRAFNGALFVGDAAGMINPLTGGGIDNALVAGTLAGQTIHEAFSANDFSRDQLKIYETRVDDEMRRSMRNSYFFQRWLLRFPFIIDILIKRMGADSSFAQTFMSKL